jgi:hypothetical protein
MKKQWKTSLSPKKYIQRKAKTLPLGKCYINKDWKESGMANIVVTRKHRDGYTTFAVYLVDLYALGTKDCFFHIHVSKYDFRDFLLQISAEEAIEVKYVLVHNIIYGANAYAEENGLKLHPDFKHAEHILMEDTDDIPLIEIEFGKGGKPLLTPFMDNDFD